jgi:hypothetical protein
LLYCSKWLQAVDLENYPLLLVVATRGEAS